jgi:hypothetical protein
MSMHTALGGTGNEMAFTMCPHLSPHAALARSEVLDRADAHRCIDVHPILCAAQAMPGRSDRSS